MTDFDYQKKVWGNTPIKPSPFYLQGLKLKYLLQDLQTIKKGKILDIGCGGGNIVNAVQHYRPDLDIYGVDPSEMAITQAQKNSSTINFKVGVAEKLPYKNNQFEAVIMLDVLEHLTDSMKALREIKRVLKPRGFFHLFLPLDKQPLTFYWLIYQLGWQPKDKLTGHVRVYDDRDFEKLAKANGFKIIDRRFSFHWLFSLFDITYFSLLNIFDLKPGQSIESLVQKKPDNPLVSFFNLGYRLVVALGYLESSFLSRLPGGGGHYLMRRSDK